MRLTANAIADAVVPLVNVSTSTPSVPVISSVTELAIELARELQLGGAGRW